MSSRPSWSLTGAICAAFTERRIYIRTGGRTRYLSIRSASQIGGAFAVAALLGWTGFTTTALVTSALDGHSARIQLETMSEAYEARLGAYGVRQRSLEEQLDQANRRRDEVTVRLSDKQTRLVETANDLQEAGAELAVLREKFESLVNARRGDAVRNEALESELAGLRVALAGAETSKANLDGALESLSGAMGEVIAERDRAASESIRLDGDVVRLTGALGRLEDNQERLLSQLEVASRTGLAGLETLFGRSNIDLDRILARARRDYSGSGGPFEPLTGDAEDAADGAGAGDTRVAALLNDLETVNLMRFAAERLPFGEPVRGGRRTSGFGPRGRSMHSGLDIAAPRGTPIYSTADGVVTLAGRQSGYGIVVKIRHAFGFETVYAHLSRARVKVGQRVGRGDRIGDMGSTGRSTGNHVHYEIRIDNKPVNPVKFIKATRDVL
jgi:murein DD-endopeptidase MepM/ murein hydrolase activator NlpD